MNMKLLVIILGLVIIVGLAVLLLIPSPEGEKEEVPKEVVSDVEPTGVVHTMVLGEDGYEPRDITIKLGDAVEFSTTGDAPYWPASNVHPTHRIYPAFDPKEPVPPEETWSFVFDQVGEWRYHDHLLPFHTGVIIVEE